ncbi:bacteriocin biosynthesis protein [Bacillus pseudomycoides]|uniref:Bacteriocin biosynthesis protein n=3 Tax=Bacillus pseudomycoides TaxID=64104 RepID=A0A2B6ID55_9BACI|nr:bacteriocin biosynthesis protein [Bacillus pseudomycoides]PED69993.1 bacteriocin biosynthesis protein [Bacillus pseudomycoides]PEF71841.1 bacteriocin biosynthesis protein [Bacillus pseudomycoides]PEI41516.1 bacteriocin biosynthesis protein [Bacillus pseudomycoides]PEJ69558.1 bacteriocin biosynthesis protein [Bacillus pseudomycoides]
MRTMEEQIFNSMIQQGAFAALFVWMLFTTQKKNEQREAQYQKVIEKNQQVIEEQAKAFGSLSKDVSDIKQKILGKGDVQ